MSRSWNVGGHSAQHQKCRPGTDHIQALRTPAPLPAWRWLLHSGSIYFTGMLVARLMGLKMSDYIMQANMFDPLGMKMPMFAPQMRVDLRERLLQMCLRTSLAWNRRSSRPQASTSSSHRSWAQRARCLQVADLRGEKERENYAAPAGIAGAGVPAVN
ncbi:hypothetical protein B0H11DRAFT_1944912 [Mycena galericulata]|nr:hypothetical protein B0H11DRAFT_1944912 [Mycena galericulata]